MKEHLNQLTLSQFVDLVCGNVEVLCSGNKIFKDEKLVLCARNIILEYRAIADPGGTNGYFKHMENWVKAKMSVIVFTMCGNLTMLKQYNKARDVLQEYGLLASKWSESRIDGTIQAKLEQSKRELSDIESENERAVMEKDKIRAKFDEQIAWLMAHFKFQIDPDSIKASLYANLVARYNREVKAMIAPMKKK